MHEEQNMRSQIKEKKNNSGTETNRTLRYLVSFLVIMGLLVVLFSGISVSVVWKCLFSISWAC